MNRRWGSVTGLTMTLLVLAFSLAGLAQSDAGERLQIGNVSVVQPWARATPAGAKVAAAFVELRAAAGTRDRLIAARSPMASLVELHDHIRDGNVLRMRRVDAIAVPEGGTVVLMPGSFHLMLVGLTAPLAEGGQLPLTLVFETSGELSLTVPILAIGSMGPDEEKRSGLKILAPKGGKPQGK